MLVKVSPVGESRFRYFVSDKVTSFDEDYTMRLYATGLMSNTHYEYTVCFSATKDSICEGLDSQTGKFVTAAEKDVAAPVKIVWGGDLAGQDVW